MGGREGESGARVRTRERKSERGIPTREHAERDMVAYAHARAYTHTRTVSRMWYVIPTPPFVVGGEERGSAQNREYALRDPPPRQLEGLQVRSCQSQTQYAKSRGLNFAQLNFSY